ncbi:acetylxylan esterase [Promicromonospora sp. NPDC057138]|uniref:acetylxylan esterase n=1 Tax=Promicromonospora sp. NPDC057138 TaxID=3346031 RepID=UPI00363C7DA7
MPRFDLPLEELTAYRPQVAEPSDFDSFWARTISDARAASWVPRVERVKSALTGVEVHDVEFAGFAGDPIRAWYLVPSNSVGRLPTVVEFNGYGGGRGRPHERLAWVSAGYAYLLMDTRGQGSAWGSGGDTADPQGAGPSAPGYMTRGIESPDTYFYRRVFTDAVRAVDVVRGFDRVDPERVAVTGGSQGGGIALAVAGLEPDLAAAMPDVPFLSHFERAVGFTGEDPYQEIVRYLAVHRDAVERTFQTLSYFDVVNLAKRSTAPALFSVALLDPICPPSTVFAASNAYAGGADVEVYRFNQHEGGEGYHWERQATWLADRIEKLDRP